MNNVFIGGIPASGKSYMAKKVAQQFGLLYAGIDDLRSIMGKDPKLEPWVNFYWNLDEEKYYRETNTQTQWKNLVSQSEAFWPIIKKKIEEVIAKGKPAIFEGVNILPHLIAQDFNFPGVYLLGESEEEIFKRIKKEPRWGETEELQKAEAKTFFNFERPKYKEEAEKYGFKTFENTEEAEKELLRLIKVVKG